jgi:hypothetical protein
MPNVEVGYMWVKGRMVIRERTKDAEGVSCCRSQGMLGRGMGGGAEKSVCISQLASFKEKMRDFYDKQQLFCCPCC